MAPKIHGSTLSPFTCSNHQHSMSSTDVKLNRLPIDITFYMHKRETLIEIQIQTFQPATIPCPWCNPGKKKEKQKRGKIHINWCAIGSEKQIIRLGHELDFGQINFLSYFCTPRGINCVFSSQVLSPAVVSSCWWGEHVSSLHRSGGIAASDTPFWVDIAEARATGIRQSPLFWRYCIALVMLVSISLTTSSSKAKASSESCASSSPCALVESDRGWPWQPYMNHDSGWVDWSEPLVSQCKIQEAMPLQCECNYRTVHGRSYSRHCNWTYRWKDMKSAVAIIEQECKLSWKL